MLKNKRVKHKLK